MLTVSDELYFQMRITTVLAVDIHAQSFKEPPTVNNNYNFRNRANARHSVGNLCWADFFETAFARITSANHRETPMLDLRR